MGNWQSAISFVSRGPWRAAIVAAALAFSVQAFAQVTSRPAPPKKAAPPATSQAGGGVAATVITPNAQVYSQANFDAQVIASVKSGQRVQVSRGKVAGPMGSFHRVRVGNRIGYIVDIDIHVDGQPRPGAVKKTPSKKDPKKKDKPEPVKPKREFYFARFVGLYVSSVDYKEDIGGVNAQQNQLFYGIKVTGPDLLISAPTDFNIMLHYGTPSYYDALSAAKPSGFIMLIDALLNIAISQKRHSSFYVGLGPMMALSKFTVFNSGKKMDLTEIDIGAAFMAGYGFRMDKVTMRLEGKYYVEKQQYKSIGASLQTEF